MNDLKRWMTLMEAVGDATRATRFIMTAEKWLSTSVAKFGVETPSMDELSPQRVAMEPLQNPAKHRKVAVFVLSHLGKLAVFVLSHLGKLADVLGITLVTGVSPEAQAFYAGFQPEGEAMVRHPTA